MNVKELREMLSGLDGDVEVQMMIERGRGVSGSSESIGVSFDEFDNVLMLCGEEDFFE